MILACYGYLASAATVVHVSVCKLNSRKPISYAFDLPDKPVLIVLLLSSSLSIPSLSSLVPIKLSRITSVTARHTKDGSDSFLRNSFLFIYSLIDVLTCILLIWLSLILLCCSSISLNLRISIDHSGSSSDILSTHWTISTSILNQFDCTELMEKMATG